MVSEQPAIAVHPVFIGDIAMTKSIYDFPVPATRIENGPTLEDCGDRTMCINFGFEDSDGHWVDCKLQFIHIEAVRCTFMTSMNTEMRDAYAKVIDLGVTPWVVECKKQMQSRLFNPSLSNEDLFHARVTFDDGPCFEFVCRKFHALCAAPKIEKQ